LCCVAPGKRDYGAPAAQTTNRLENYRAIRLDAGLLSPKTPKHEELPV
jgi:hypothetical protein